MSRGLARVKQGTSGSRRRLPPWGMILIIVLIAFIIHSPQKYVHQFNTAVDEDVVDYLHVGREYTLFYMEEVVPAFAQFEEIPAELLIDLQFVHDSFQEDIVSLHPPKHFEAYHESLIEIVVRQASILQEAKKIREGKVAAFNELIERNNEANSRLIEQLKQALTANDIPFSVLENGLIEYEVQLSNPSKEFTYQRAQEEFEERWQRLQE